MCQVLRDDVVQHLGGRAHVRERNVFVVCMELGVDVPQAGPAVVGSKPVSDAAVPAGHAQVGPTGHEDGDDARARVSMPQRCLDRPVQVGVGRRGRGRFTEEALDMHVVREVAKGPP